MSLPAPNLDDRRFQDLVDDAKRFIARRCPEWSDHNVSDPGVTLVEAFATMVDQLLYRLNRVPDRHYVKFLELIGVSLFPPTAARTAVTFWLSGPQPETVRVPAGTLVSTPRTEFDEAITFTTRLPLDIVASSYASAASTSGGRQLDRSVELSDGQGVSVFSASPVPGDAFYVGMSTAAPNCALSISLDCRTEGIGVDPNWPPLRWEAFTGVEWSGCEVDSDTTGGLNRSGRVVLHLPAEHAASLVAGSRAAWVRCVVQPPEDGQPTYRASPVVRKVTAFACGGTVEAQHGERVAGEPLGSSDGTAGQVFPVPRSPVVATADPELVEVGGDRGWQPWILVGDFASSGPDDRHVVVDRGLGEVRFGPAVREADGTLRRFGAVPDKGAPVRMTYRVGGGSRGNVGPGALRVLRSSLAYVARVENRRAAIGGVDGETIDNAKQRGPLLLRTRSRAVTAEDYEVLARQVAPDLARVHCVAASASDAAEPGVVRLLVVPRPPGDPEAQLDFAALRPDAEVVERVGRYLDERRTLGARLVVEPPLYRGVTVVARLQAEPAGSPVRVRVAALAAVYRYLHPTIGGPGGNGWPLGRPLLAGDVHAVLQSVPGVSVVEDVRLFPADPVEGRRSDTPVPRVELGPTELLFSFEHQLRVD